MCILEYSGIRKALAPTEFIPRTTARTEARKYEDKVGFSQWRRKEEQILHVFSAKRDEVAKNDTEIELIVNYVEVEDAEEDKEKKPKTNKVEKTVWDWELMNDTKNEHRRQLSIIESKCCK
ncbi:Hypothetical predicted protein [Paramuricea clavata]|uniref:Uncharacterized protein n=1 Tax=Paramuricea clavata TaxID=317549 RepID=A0A6S7KET6_PARCT|nr:Hypothetical predicted protein [Paramuricea clavata]